MGGAGPPMMNAGYNANYQIVQGARLRDDSHRDDPRRTHHPARRPPGALRRTCASGLAYRAAAGRAIRSWSRRRTSTARIRSRGSSENLRVIERFTRVAEDAIHYRFTVEDPSTWARPWTGELPMQKIGRPDLRARLPRGNYGMSTRSPAHGRREEGRRGSRSEAETK